MFYLETKDGEQYLTSPKSDDTEEFGSIIEEKMGRDAKALYDWIVSSSQYR